MKMKKHVGWNRSRGMVMSVPPVGRRNDPNDPFAEVALFCEEWLISEKGYAPNQLIEYELGKQLRSEFFYAHIDTHPEWFSAKGVENMGNGTYRCRGCSIKLNPTTLSTCCNS